ncbi:PREDICTED: uncharacterized protein LOC108616898 [Drosophila arizonae]|uniref:Uncharacterized protein LOC108616898 n=1 Tax=Drosophila arizonae TaxID=7263 RepID=A0ABM1PL19_DROAR|nr:PREDICTED: uncharacterized protein LOC108616898 [Drosophila arizonae]
MKSHRLYRLRYARENQGPQVSEANTLSNKSKSSDFFREHGNLKQVTRQDGKNIVEDIIDSIFDKEAGKYVASSSRCSIVTGFEGSEHMDKRLKQWHDTLRDRARVQAKIHQRIGRRPEQMLLNQSGTLDQRNKGNITRIIDYADRLNPTRLVSQQYGVLPAHSDAKQCVFVPEVQQTVPLPERSGVADLEITGLSNATNQEIFGLENARKGKTSWINSEELEKSLNLKYMDIDRVVEFFPDMRKLEVIASNQNLIREPQSDIDLVAVKSLYSVSSITETNSPAEDQKPPVKVPLEPKVVSVGLRVNDREFIKDHCDTLFPSARFEYHFECTPFERQFKQVMRLENIGQNILFCEWLLADPSMHYCRRCFFFERNQFRLYPGDVHIINVMYRPNEVLLTRQFWKLRIFPHIFCNRRNGLMLLLVGKCVAPPEYLWKINKQLDLVIDKSLKARTVSLTQLHAELAPLIKPHEQLHPYERTLDEREQFNIQNVGYHCERFDDIEALRALYNEVKMPREPAWDMRLDTIKRFIIRLPEPNRRMMYFQILLNILPTLHCTRDQQSPMHCEHSNERERSCFIYVRGCIGNGIDEWEDLMMGIEESCFKTEIHRFCTLKDDTPNPPCLKKLKDENPAVYVHRVMQGKKYYRDALYMHTYTQLCDIAENVASVIESTQYV